MKCNSELHTAPHYWYVAQVTGSLAVVWASSHTRSGRVSVAGWRHQQMASALVGALVDSGNKLIRRRPVDLATFLATLDATEPRRLLDSAEGRRHARHQLDLAWEQTVSSLEIGRESCRERVCQNE